MPINDSGKCLMTIEMNSERGAKEYTLLQRFLMALMQTFAGAAV
jgi:hypothetical protein